MSEKPEPKKRGRKKKTETIESQSNIINTEESSTLSQEQEGPKKMVLKAHAFMVNSKNSKT